MSFPYYEAGGEQLSEFPAKMTLPPPSEEELARDYEPNDDLVDAVNVAILLGQPLLLTGDPGTGKTQLAYSVNWKLRFVNPKPFSFETKSTSAARDLFYTYDAIGRFHAAQNAQIEYQRLRALTENSSTENIAAMPDLPKDTPADHISYNALGLAILLANDWETARQFLPYADSPNPEAQFDKIKKLKQFEFLGKNATIETWQRRSVVLIDEIDKAPRDFPNDILNEIEKMFFRVPELNSEISVKKEDKKHNEAKEYKEYRPVIILTSNSERNLPDAFLRRCAYYHIEFPKLEQLRKIVVKRLFPELPNESPDPKDWLDDALGLFSQIRKMNIFKKPATAELLGWMMAIQSKALNTEHKRFKDLSGDEKRKFANMTLTILLKNESDRKKAQSITELNIPPTESEI